MAGSAAGHTHVPEKRSTVAAIDQRRRIVAPDAVENTDRDSAAVGEGALGIVTGRTGEGIISREAAIEEQSPPECDVFLGERIMLGCRKVEI